MDPSDKHRTQLDMLALAGTKLPAQTPERAALHGAPGTDSTLKSGAASNKRVHFAKGTSDGTSEADEAQSGTISSTTVGPLRLRTAWDAPWKKYDKIYDLELGGPLVVAIRKASPVELVHVREFPTQAASESLHLFRFLQHRNIVHPLEAFTTDSNLHIVLEYMPVSLQRIIDSPAYPDEQQLAAILGQIVAGLAYLAAEGYEHGSLTCSSILLNTGGDVKIANQHRCVKITRPKGTSRDVRALSPITMELMQKYVKEDGAVGIDNLLRWSSDSDAVAFLSATASAASATELLQACCSSTHYQVTYPDNRSIPS